MIRSKLLGLFGSTVVAVTIGLLALPSWAQSSSSRSQDYAPSQFISVLNGLGYPVELTDTIESPKVKQAIRDFQLQYNLPVSGTITPDSQNTAAALVQNLQQSLNRLLKPQSPLPENQFYGSQTEALVKAFQDQNRLPMTGIATLETRRRLAELLTSNPNSTTERPTTSSATATVPMLTQPIRPVDDPATAEPNPPVPQTPNPNVRFGRLYTDAEFRAILLGLGYDIAPQKFLSDRAAIVAILDFQRRYGLQPTGTADQPTQELAKTLLRVLQANLRTIGNKNLLTTEFYDAQTEQAVREFQRQYQLRVDGIATIPVRQRIDAVAKQVLNKSKSR